MTTSEKSKMAVVALGGNAISREGESGTHEEQARNATAMAKAVRSLVEAGWHVVLVHGNGPQVGNLLLQQESGGSQVPGQPLFSLDAMTQGQIGSILTLALHDQIGAAVPAIATVVTHVVVSADDPAFAAPTKPVGPFYEAIQAHRLREQLGWTVVEDAGRGFRRLVPSPEPLAIVELEVVQALAGQGMVVVAAGGGGVPVVRSGGELVGVDAVIDKDRSACLLASQLHADALVLVTDVENVKVDFNTPRERDISDLSVDEAQRHLDDGQFPPGSMGPKVDAAIRFVRNGGKTSVITSSRSVARALDDDPTDGVRPGTRIRQLELSPGACR